MNGQKLTAQDLLQAYQDAIAKEAENGNYVAGSRKMDVTVQLCFRCEPTDDSLPMMLARMRVVDAFVNALQAMQSAGITIFDKPNIDDAVIIWPA